jgi:hypothetical protein
MMLTGTITDTAFPRQRLLTQTGYWIEKEKTMRLERGLDVVPLIEYHDWSWRA